MLTKEDIKYIADEIKNKSGIDITCISDETTYNSNTDDIEENILNRFEVSNENKTTNIKELEQKINSIIGIEKHIIILLLTEIIDDIKTNNFNDKMLNRAQYYLKLAEDVIKCLVSVNGSFKKNKILKNKFIDRSNRYILI